MEKLEIRGRRRSVEWGSWLPPLIGETIFSKLEISNLPVCRLVCKHWNEIVLNLASSSKLQLLTNAFLLCISDRVPNCEFIGLRNPKMHCINLDTRKYLDVDVDVDFDLKSELECIKSASLQFDGDWSYISINNQCNGLLFISKCGFFDRWDGIFNPMTNEFIQVPRYDLDFDIHVFGFGFSPTSKKYKLFRIFDSEESRTVVPDTNEEFSIIMDVLTFDGCGTKLNEWRHLRRLPFDIINHGVYLNGLIYWLGKENDKEDEYIICALDVETEIIEVVLKVGPCSKVWTLHQFNGTIYATFLFDLPTKTIQVWRMIEKDSWIREFIINDIPNDWNSPKLVKTFEDGEILLMINMDFFCFYNPITGRKKMIHNNQKKLRQICQIDSLNFDSLSNILTGNETSLRNLF